MRHDFLKFLRCPPAAAYAVMLLLAAALPFLFPGVSRCDDAATITSDRMKILSKGEVNDFLGHVKLVHVGLTINSDEMKADERTGDTSARGDIYIFYSTGAAVTHVWGDDAKYNRGTGRGLVTGHVRVKRELTPGTTDVINMTCDELEIFDSGARLHAIKNVRIFKPDTDAFGSEAFYEHKSDELLLTGSPAKIKRTDGKTISEYSGDKVHVNINTGTITITGRVKTKVILE